MDGTKFISKMYIYKCIFAVGFGCMHSESSTIYNNHIFFTVLLGYFRGILSINSIK